jgi:hypothetical protein
MSLTRLVVMRPRSRGAPRARSPATTGVSRGWVHELVKRYDAEGEAGLVPRSRRQRTSPQRKPEALAYEVVQLRKHLAKQGLDAGAVTIAYDLAQRHGRASARSTTWRILSRRASSPCSHKRPKGSYVRFEAAMPNKRWQADVTRYKLADGVHVEVLNLINDYSRFLVTSHARADRSCHRPSGGVPSGAEELRGIAPSRALKLLCVVNLLGGVRRLADRSVRGV